MSKNHHPRLTAQYAHTLFLFLVLVGLSFMMVPWNLTFHLRAPCQQVIAFDHLVLSLVVPVLLLVALALLLVALVLLLVALALLLEVLALLLVALALY